MKHKKIIAFLSAAAFLLSGCENLPSKEDLTYTDTLYDTVIDIQILDPVEQDIMDGLKKLCRKYDILFSKTDENSDIFRINTAGGAPVEVSEDTLTLLKKSIYYGDLSGGLFDVTIGTVSSLWDFKTDTPSVPSKEALSSAVSHVNYKNIIIILVLI